MTRYESFLWNHNTCIIQIEKSNEGSWYQVISRYGLNQWWNSTHLLERSFTIVALLLISYFSWGTFCRIIKKHFSKIDLSHFSWIRATYCFRKLVLKCFLGPSDFSFASHCIDSFTSILDLEMFNFDILRLFLQSAPFKTEQDVLKKVARWRHL